MKGFSDAVAFVLQPSIEGALSMDPTDPGNWTSDQVNVGELRGTNFGISAAAHPDVDIKNLTKDGAAAILKAGYWSPLSLDSIPYFLALPTFDMSVNQGPETAARNLQRALRVTVDGKIGGGTIAVARIASIATLDQFMALRAVLYANDKGFDADGQDWLRRCFAVTRAALST